MDLEITGQRTSNTHLHDAHNFTSHITRNTYPLTKLNTRTAYPLEVRKKKQKLKQEERSQRFCVLSFKLHLCFSLQNLKLQTLNLKTTVEHSDVPPQTLSLCSFKHHRVTGTPPPHHTPKPLFVREAPFVRSVSSFVRHTATESHSQNLRRALPRPLTPPPFLSLRHCQGCSLLFNKSALFPL